MEDFNYIYNISVKSNVIFSCLAEEKKIGYYLKKNKSIILQQQKCATGQGKFYRRANNKTHIFKLRPS